MKHKLENRTFIFNGLDNKPVSIDGVTIELPDGVTIERDDGMLTITLDKDVEHAEYILNSDSNGSITVTGDGPGDVARMGDGEGDVIRGGIGQGNPKRYGRGHGYSIRHYE